MPLQATSGAASYDAFGGGVPVVPKYIEEYFSTFLYTGTGAAQTITNNIDLSTKGGLVWIKKRNAAEDHVLTDTVRGAGNTLFSNLTDANEYDISRLSAFTSSGFSVGTSTRVNQSTNTYASWTFAKAPKFFDVVTYTGTGTARTVAHNLGSAPGFMLIKQTSGTEDWAVYHRSLGYAYYMSIRTTDPALPANANVWNNTDPTSTVFSVGAAGILNASGQTYVAYLFAHNAGGFGLTGTDNVISCGSYTGSSNTPQQITLGYEPQWVLLKKSSTTSDWYLLDNMRGMALSTGGNSLLYPNTSSAEDVTSNWVLPNATGFVAGSSATDSATYIYIAIRRGPMKVPTSGTSVFNSVARTGDRLAGSLTGIGFNPDSLITLVKSGGYQHEWNNKLAGSYQLLRPTTNESEFTSTDLKSYDQDGISFNATDFNSNINRISPLIQYFLKRAPSVFDIVCYSGNSTARTINHNLGVAPELMIVKSRNLSGGDWQTYASPIGNSSRLLLNTTDALADGQPTWNYTTPTSSVFSLGTSSNINGTSYTYVAYLFATCAGVSKVGSYTGTGALQTINCGFTGGARFVLIKRTDSTGSWWLYDSTRGISSSDDPYLFLNSNAAEVTNTNYVDTDTTGFKVTAAAPADLNSSGGTYIFLAIA